MDNKKIELSIEEIDNLHVSINDKLVSLTVYARRQLEVFSNEIKNTQCDTSILDGVISNLNYVNKEMQTFRELRMKLYDLKEQLEKEN